MLISPARRPLCSRWPLPTLLRVPALGPDRVLVTARRACRTTPGGGRDEAVAGLWSSGTGCAGRRSGGQRRASGAGAGAVLCPLVGGGRLGERRDGRGPPGQGLCRRRRRADSG